MLFCVTQNSTKGPEMLCKVFTWWIFSYWMDSTSFFPEGGFRWGWLHVHADAWGTLSDSSVVSLYLMKWFTPAQRCWSGLLRDGHSFLSCLSPSVDFFSPWDNIQSPWGPGSSAPNRFSSNGASPGTQAALSIPSWLCLMEHINPPHTFLALPCKFPLL